MTALRHPPPISLTVIVWPLIGVGALCLAGLEITGSAWFGGLAAAVFAALIVIKIAISPEANNSDAAEYDFDASPDVNPTTGFPLVPNSFIDVSGTPYGQRRHE